MKKEFLIAIAFLLTLGSTAQQRTSILVVNTKNVKFTVNIPANNVVLEVDSNKLYRLKIAFTQSDSMATVFRKGSAAYATINAPISNAALLLGQDTSAHWYSIATRDWVRNTYPPYDSIPWRTSGEVTYLKDQTDSLYLPSSVIFNGQQSTLAAYRTGRRNTYCSLGLNGFGGQTTLTNSLSNSSNVVTSYANQVIVGALGVISWSLLFGGYTSVYYLDNTGFYPSTAASPKNYNSLGTSGFHWHGLYADSLIFLPKLNRDPTPTYFTTYTLATGRIQQRLLSYLCDTVHAQVLRGIKQLYDFPILGNSTNTGIGNQTLANSGQYGVGFGIVAVGDSALNTRSANLSTVVGVSAFKDYAGSAGSNSGLGFFVGKTVTNGQLNSFFGFKSGSNVSQLANVTNSMALGANTYTTTHNQIMLGDANITETILRAPRISTNDTTGLGSTAHIGMMVYQSSAGHFYGLKGGAPPTWVQLDN